MENLFKRVTPVVGQVSVMSAAWLYFLELIGFKRKGSAEFLLKFVLTQFITWIDVNSISHRDSFKPFSITQIEMLGKFGLKTYLKTYQMLHKEYHIITIIDVLPIDYPL